MHSTRLCKLCYLSQVYVILQVEQHPSSSQPVHQQLSYQDSLRSANSQTGIQQPSANLPGCSFHMHPDRQVAEAAGQLLDATSVSGLLQQPVLQSRYAGRGSLPASRPGSAGSQGQHKGKRKPGRPRSATALGPGLTVPAAQAVLGHATAAYQPGQTSVVLPAQMQQALEAAQDAAALPAVDWADARPLPLGRALQRHKSSTASNLLSTSSKTVETETAQALAQADSMACASRLLTATSGNDTTCQGSRDTAQASADPVWRSNRQDSAGTAQGVTAAEWGRHSQPQGSAGTAQAASSQDAVPDFAGVARSSEAEGLRLKALLQDRGLQELAALLSSEESDNESDFSEDSSGGSGDATAQGSARVSSCVEQDEVAGQPQVESASATTVRLSQSNHCQTDLALHDMAWHGMAWSKHAALRPHIGVQLGLTDLATAFVPPRIRSDDMLRSRQFACLCLYTGMPGSTLIAVV